MPGHKWTERAHGFHRFKFRFGPCPRDAFILNQFSWIMVERKDWIISYSKCPKFKTKQTKPKTFSISYPVESYSWKTTESKWTLTVIQPNFPSSEKRLTYGSPDKRHPAPACIPSPGHSLPPQQTTSTVSSLANRHSSFHCSETRPSWNLPLGPQFALWKYSLRLFPPTPTFFLIFGNSRSSRLLLSHRLNIRVPLCIGPGASIHQKPQASR